MVRTYLACFSLLLLFACGAQEAAHEPETEGIKGEYRLIRDDLYVDKKGNIYHRTDDVSLEDGKRRDTYRHYLLFDTVINGEQKFINRDLKDVVDTATFHEETVADGAKDLFKAYRDKNNDYMLKIMADGGTLMGKRRTAAIEGHE